MPFYYFIYTSVIPLQRNVHSYYFVVSIGFVLFFKEILIGDRYMHSRKILHLNKLKVLVVYETNFLTDLFTFLEIRSKFLL